MAWLVPAWGNGIFTCTDAQGRRLTSDRPIFECMDREQRELSPTGTVRRVIKPEATAAERAAEEVRARREQDEHLRVREERLRQRGLLTRYPNEAALEKERAIALGARDDRIATAQARKTVLAQERRKLDQDLAAYRQSPNKVPALLKHSIELNEAQRVEQERFIAEQTQDKQQLITRFDEMRRQLLPQWGPPKAEPTTKR
jgi:hypothetical protein